MNKITINPIGIIRSPYREPKDIPIQGLFKEDVEAWVELYEKYETGLKDLDEFSHAMLIYYFHKSTEEKLISKPFLEDVEHGIFAIRSPNRPNHIGVTIVKINKIEKNRIYFSHVDMLDNTPVLDIKPLVKYFDSYEKIKSGWTDKHFRDRKIPDDVILNRSR